MYKNVHCYKVCWKIDNMENKKPDNFLTGKIVIFSCVVYRSIMEITVWKFQLKSPEEAKNLHFQKTMSDKLIKSLQSDRLGKV